MLRRSLSKKIPLTIPFLLLVSLVLVNYLNTEANIQPLTSNQQNSKQTPQRLTKKQTLITPTIETTTLATNIATLLPEQAETENRTALKPQNPNETRRESPAIESEYPVIPNELEELEANYDRQLVEQQQNDGAAQLGSDVLPLELINMETIIAENAALGIETSAPYSPMPAIEAEEPIIPEELEILEQQHERLASQEYNNVDYNIPSEFGVLPYELQQIEADPTTSALYDTSEAEETDIRVMPDELKKLEQNTD